MNWLLLFCRIIVFGNFFYRCYLQVMGPDLVGFSLCDHVSLSILRVLDLRGDGKLKDLTTAVSWLAV